MSEATRLRSLAAKVGLAASHTEIGGRRRQVSTATLRAVIAALGYPMRGRGMEAALAQSALQRQNVLAPPVIPSFEPHPVRIPLGRCIAGAGTLEWTLEGEAQQTFGRVAFDELHDGDAPVLVLPSLAPGYYRLHLVAGERRAETLVIRAPAKAWLPNTLERGRGFGLAVQLYELVGPESIGIGDFGDLAGLGKAVGRTGATTLGINPLHALFLSDPERVSPYSPSSRLALNPLYLDVRRLPGFPSRARERFTNPAFIARVAALNAQPVVDYAGAAREKLALARAAFDGFRAAGDDRTFERFCREANGAQVWARHEAIAAEQGADWRAWQAPLREPDSAAVERYAAEHADAVDFHLWLQWQAELQLGAAARAARDGGMGVGLYRDLALGADPGGAETWAGQAHYVAGLAVGAPPDPFNPRGQNWGFPPLNPERLGGNGFAPFIELIRTNMRHAGALRIDHVLGLKRLFVIPDGAKPGEGAYLHYPFETLLAAIVLESARAQCLVVGEDLGTVPRGLRATLARRGILSLRLLYFERDRRGRPRPPEAWPRNALAAVGTHDMAPLAGWWHETDLALRDRLALWPDDATREAAHAARPGDRGELAEALGAGSSTAAEAEVPAAAAYRYLARAPSRLMMIQPEDTLGIEAPVNVPGTTDEVANWRRRRLPPWPEWLSDPRFLEALRAVQIERGPSPQTCAPPVATYRLQLHRDFGFREAARRVAYLARLGISHVYLSPVTMSAPGSMHGYDMVDPARLDAERGGEADFAELVAASGKNGLGSIVDFVPNHMGVHATNPWWMDLLEWGQTSRYADAFDVDWSVAGGRVVLPLLGAPFGKTIVRKEIRLAFDPSGGFLAQYYDHRLPLAPTSVAALLNAAARDYGGPGRKERQHALQTLAQRARTLRKHPLAEQRAAGLVFKADLAALAEETRACAALAQAAAVCASDPDRLRRLLARQPWRLAYWRRGLEEVNYRRFFDVASLAAMRTERPAVFAAAHVRIRALLAERAIDGLRLDHVDGLAAPARYLAALDALVAVHGGGVRLWVEKILGVNEVLPPWPVAGTSGYEFLNDVTRLFVSETGAERLRGLWRTRIPDARSFDATLARAKREAVRKLLAPMLARVTDSLAPQAPASRRILRNALVEAVVALPVYRAYPNADNEAGLTDRQLIMRMAGAASGIDSAVGDWLARLFETSFENEPHLPASLRDGLNRFWQLASAAMAKGLEDTAFYRDFALLALNEVGGDPRVASLSTADFHRRMRARVRDWPAALSASATHDTKRGEDARLRLALLSSHAEAWAELVPRLHAATESLASAAVHPADEYLVWQTLAAIWPPGGMEPPDAEERERLDARLGEYLVKALREGKTRSSWLAPRKDYEAVVTDYAHALLDPVRGEEFQRAFLPFVAELARHGALASLAALALKLTAPGIPDFYQSTELWDLTLVDPDNRRPVDYALRERLLAELEPGLAGRPGGRAKRVGELLAAWPDGRIKLYVLTSLLRLRRRHPEIFANGSYEPLAAKGVRSDDVLAFRRAYRNEEVLVVMARVCPALVENHRCALAAGVWKDTRCETGPSKASAWRELLTGRRYPGGELAATGLLSPLPVAVLLPQR